MSFPLAIGTISGILLGGVISIIALFIHKRRGGGPLAASLPIYSPHLASRIYGGYGLVLAIHWLPCLLFQWSYQWTHTALVLVVGGVLILASGIHLKNTSAAS